MLTSPITNERTHERTQVESVMPRLPVWPAVAEAHDVPNDDVEMAFVSVTLQTTILLSDSPNNNGT